MHVRLTDRSDLYPVPFDFYCLSHTDRILPKLIWRTRMPPKWMATKCTFGGSMELPVDCKSLLTWADLQLWERRLLMWKLTLINSFSLCLLNSHSFWLRDHCHCSECYHTVTKQRLVNTFKVWRQSTTQMAMMSCFCPFAPKKAMKMWYCCPRLTFYFSWYCSLFLNNDSFREPSRRRVSRQQTQASISSVRASCIIAHRTLCHWDHSPAHPLLLLRHTGDHEDHKSHYPYSWLNKHSYDPKINDPYKPEGAP